METQPKWKAGLAFACYLALAGGILIGSLVVGLVLLSMGIIHPEHLPFPVALISIPVNEAIILVITLLFARYKGAGLKELGLKKANARILTIVSVVAVPLFLLGVSISAGEEMIFGPDPMAELVEATVMPRDPFQMVAMVAFYLVLVGPCEELAMRGFVQRGFESSFGKRWSLLVNSVLFGLLHGLSTPYAVVPIFVLSLVFGYVWQRTSGNTTATALMHGVYDSIVIATAYFLSL